MAFEQSPLESICLLIADCPHSTPIWTASGYIVIRNQNIKDGRLDLSSPSYTDGKSFTHRTRRAKPRAGDIIITREAPMGDVCMIPRGLECCVGQRQVLLRANPVDMDERFLLYALQSPRVQHQIGWSEGTGPTVSNLRIPHLKALKIPTPPRPLQTEIAEVMGALDDRIELLRQTNITLEAVAQALFKSWFIDFDPVHAKTEGREPDGVDAATAALFPDSFEDSPLGPIPQGWRTDEIGNVVNCIGGTTPSTKEPSFCEPAEHHWVTPKALSGLAAPVLMDTNRKVSTAGLKKISSGTLPKGTLLRSSRAPIGYLAVAQIPTAINQGFIAMPPGGELPPAYLLFWTQWNMDSIKQKANGSTFMEISKSTFRPIKLCVPPEGIVTAFVSIAEPLLERIATNEAQRTQLAQLRDTLLPRLISGKLRLPEAQTLIEESTP